MRLKWYRGLSEIEALRDSWRAFEKQVQQRTVYCRYDYIIPWYRCYSETDFTDRGIPLVGVAWENDSIVGIAPMISARSSFVKVPLRRADCAGYNLAAGEMLLKDHSEGIIEAFVSDLLKEQRFELVNINGIALDSARYFQLAEYLTRERLRFNQIKFHGFAIADLSAGYDGYRMSFGWKFRSRQKNISKRLEAAGHVRIDRINSTDDRSRASEMRRRMIEITENSQRVRVAGVSVERRHQPFYDAIFERFGAESAMDAAIVNINGEDAAYMFGLIERNVYYHTMMSYRESCGNLSPGKYLLQEVLRYLPGLGVHTVLSHGSYDYKTRWASRMVPQHTLCVFGSGFRARLSHAIGSRFVHNKEDPGIIEDEEA